MPLTLRPTKGFGPDHFSAFEGQRKIGRIYKTRENGWFWGVDWFEAGFKPVAHYAATREQALADLQKAWDELLWAKVLDAQRRVRKPETIARASIIAPAAIVLVLALSSGGVLSSTASAQPSIEVGPRGVRVNPDADRYERRGYRRGERCEVRVERRRNRFGEMVTRRERICR